MEGLAVTFSNAADPLKYVLAFSSGRGNILLVAWQESERERLRRDWIVDESGRLRTAYHAAAVKVDRPNGCDHSMAWI